MKKIIICIFYVILILSLTIQVYAEPSYPEDLEAVFKDGSDLVVNNVEAKVHVNESNVIRNIDKRMLGMQYEGNADSVFPDDTSEELSEEYKEFAKTLYKIPIARWGGASANDINPLENMGPKSSRKAGIYTDDYYFEELRGKSVEMVPQQFGIVEWIKTVQATNPDAEFIICLSLNTATPEDNANFASFLLDDKDASRWGALRASYGLPDPINLHSFELGNEVDLDGNKNKNIENLFWIDEGQLDWYCKIARKNIDAIKAVHPEAKFMGCGKSSPQNDDPLGWEVWDIKIAEAIGEDLDYYAYHLYHGGYHLAYTEWQLAATADHLKSVLGEDYPAKIFITEQATWPNDHNYKDNMFEDSKVLTLYACLDTAQFFNRMYINTNVFGANYHACYGPHKMWSLVKKMDGQWVKMGLNYIYDLYDKNLGDRVVEVSLESDNVITDKNSTASRFTVLATPNGEHELIMFLNNMSEDTSLSLSFDFKNKYTLKSETVFTAPNLRSYVCSPEAKDVFTTTQTDKNISNFTEYQMPAKSCVVLKLSTDSVLPGISNEAATDDETVYSGENQFSDIDSCWAKNEINIMKDKGVINGINENEFAPYLNVTRGQAAKIISLSLELPTIKYNNLYSDVLKDNMFADYIQAMYANGFMFGDGDGKYNPDEKITYNEFAVMCDRIYSAKHINENTNYDVSYLNDFIYKDTIASWAKNSMSLCVEKNIFKRLFENGCLNGNQPVRRVDMIYVLYRLIML